MKSVADALRRELAVEVRAMSVDERFALVGLMADHDLSIFRAATGLSRDEALRQLTARRRRGRRPSRAATDDA